MVILSLLLPLNQPPGSLWMATDHALTVPWPLMVDFCQLKMTIKGRFVHSHSVSIIPPRIDQFSSDHWSQTRTGRVSTYMGDRLGIPCVLSTFFIWFWLNRTWGIHFWPYQYAQRPSSGHKKVKTEADSKAKVSSKAYPNAKIHLTSLERAKLKLYSSHFWVRFRLSNR